MFSHYETLKIIHFVVNANAVNMQLFECTRSSAVLQFGKEKHERSRADFSE